MPKSILRIALIPLVFASASVGQAQSTETPKPAETQESYVLTLTLKITDQAKVTTNQVYTLTALNAVRDGSLSSLDNRAREFSNPSVRDGNRVPILTSKDGDKSEVQYIDIGTNIDIQSVQKVGSLLAMQIKIENSAALPNPEWKEEPLIRQTRYSIAPAVTIGKLSTVYSSTDAVDGHKVEILLLAKPLDAK